MKKTLIALMALAGMASAATQSLTYWAGNTGGDILKLEGDWFPYLGLNGGRLTGNAFSSLTTPGNTDYTLNFNVSDRDSNSFAVNNGIYLNQITTTTDTISTSLSIAFGANGSITCASSINFGTHVAGRTVDEVKTNGALTLSATLSDAELASLASGKDVSRTLISGDYFTNTVFADLVANTTLTLTGTDATYAGVIYAETNGDETTYYSAADVNTQNAGIGDTQYVSAKSDAKALELEAGKSYIVIGANYNAGYSSMKRISYLVTAPIPEPTTATLSLLALAGLCARRRRA